MPQFDKLEVSFKDDPDVQAVLGMIYADILEFHQRYPFFPVNFSLGAENLGVVLGTPLSYCLGS